jgi:hypothetical protein
MKDEKWKIKSQKNERNVKIYCILNKELNKNFKNYRKK